MKYAEGKIAVPQGPGLGVELDRDRRKEFAELYRRTGGVAYDRDRERPAGYSIMPARRSAQGKSSAARKKQYGP